MSVSPTAAKLRRASRDALLDTLLDVRSIFDPHSTMTMTLQEALGGVARRAAVAWVALPDPEGGLVIEHVLGERTRELQRLDVGSGQGLTGRVFERSKVHWVEEYVGAATITHEFDSIIEAEAIRRMIAAPLSAGESVLGVLSVGRRDFGDFGDNDIAHVERLAQRASMALGLARAARDHAAAAAVAERRRVSEELHDGVGALLFSLVARTERLQRRVGLDDVAAEFATLRAELGEVSSMVGSLVAQWHESATTDLQAEIRGIVEDFERRSEIAAAAVFLGPVPPLDTARMRAVTRFVGVALSNVERHADASRVSVTISALPTQLSVVVTNNGPSPAAVVPGVGLGGAEERISRLGGTLTHEAEDNGSGFVVRVRIPL